MTWQNLPVLTPSGGVVAAGTNLTANGAWIVPSAGWSRIRPNLTAITGGTETTTLNASAGSVPPPLTSGGGQASDLVACANIPISKLDRLPDDPDPDHRRHGLSVKTILVANNTTSIAVKSTAGQVYGFNAYSISAATPVS